MTEVRKTIRGAAPAIPYERIATLILGRSYHVSLVICGDKLATRMNKQYRLPALRGYAARRAGKKSYAPNVLSFEIDRREGEIFLNLRKAEREAKQYGTTLQKRMTLLFVHGCYHLKGFDHQTERDTEKMEALEQRTLKKFGLL